MAEVLYFEINAFALSILFVIFMSMQYRSIRYLTGEKLFLALLAINALAMILDTITFIADGKSGAIAIFLRYALSPIGYMLTTTSLLLWNLYVRYQVNRDDKSIKKVLIVFVTPVVINAVLAILSCFYEGFYYFIDANNSYKREKLFIFYALLCFIYIMYPEIYIIIKRKQITGRHFIPLVVFAIPPIIGGILQTFIRGTSLVWIGMTISVLIIFLNIQNDQLYTDHLTGLSNRMHLDRYLEERTRKVFRKGLLGGIMIDLDFFKQINDTWGHMVGDQALVYTGRILQMSFRKDDLICRYGGDEFVIIFEIEKEADLIAAVDRMKMNLTKFGEQNPTPYKLSFSIGYGVFDLNSETDASLFLKQLDSLMYEDKKVNKALG